jgi:putative hydrolase of the HAD superfamily
MAPVALIGFDGDDTLWHSERYFAGIQDRIRALLAPWTDAATFDEALLVTERANLGRFGYGVKGFVLSTIETAIELTGGRVPASAIGRIIDWGKELLDHPVELLVDVADVLPALAASHRLVLITKGDLFHQETKVAGSGLAELFEAVHIVSEKTPDTYRRVLDEAGVDPASFVMVGNSLRSDVLPAAEIGGRGVHVPYHITWGLEHAELPAALADRVVHLDRLAHLPPTLDRLH